MSESEDNFEAELDGFPTEIDPRRVRSREQVEVLASEFADRVRQGQRPRIEDYLARYPQLAQQINELFPMVAALEQWKSDRESELLRTQLPDQFKLKQLGDCRIVREIGRGGMGVVFEALQGSLERRVAVKLLPWRISVVPHRQAKFEQEAITIARLKHANIVPIYSFGTQDDYAFYVMQYVSSVSLSHVIRRLGEVEMLVLKDEIRRARQNPGDAAAGSGLDSDEALLDSATLQPEGIATAGPSVGQRTIGRRDWKTFARIGVQIAQALRHAHQRGVLHNDVKPGNLLLDERGKAWITDFGLAEEIDTDSTSEHVTGTLRYMAPERFDGSSDPTSDVYSLGITLLELVTRQAAFASDSRSSLLKQISTETVRRASSLEPQTPPALDAIINRATQRSPQSRYQTAGELASDLLRFINDEPVTAQPRRSLFGWLRRRSR